MKKWQGNLMLTAAAVIWGCAFAAQSSAMDHVGPWTFVCVRSLLASAALYTLRPFLSAGRKKTPAADRRAGILLGVILLAACAFQQFGVLYSSAGKAGFLTALYIIIVPLLSVALKEKIPLQIWPAVLLASVGLYFLSFQGRPSVEKGDFFLLCCALMYAVYIIAIDRTASGADSVHVSCIQFLVTGVLAVIPMLLEHPEVSSLLGAWKEILYAGICSSAGGYTLQIIGQKYTDPSSAGMLMSLESVFALLAGVIILHEAVSFQEAAGCVLIFAAILLSQMNFDKKKSS